MTITPEQLHEWLALADGATKGPWKNRLVDDKDKWGEDDVVASDESVVIGTFWHDGPHATCSETDAAFIAAARTAVPALIAEVLRLDAVCADRAMELQEKTQRIAELEAKIQRMESDADDRAYERAEAIERNS